MNTLPKFLAERPRIWLSLVLTCILLATALAYVWARGLLQQETKQRFARAQSNIVERISGRLRELELTASALQGFFAASQNIDNGEWQRYFAKIDHDKRLPGLLCPRLYETGSGPNARLRWTAFPERCAGGSATPPPKVDDAKLHASLSEGILRLRVPTISVPGVAVHYLADIPIKLEDFLRESLGDLSASLIDLEIRVSAPQQGPVVVFHEGAKVLGSRQQSSFSVRLADLDFSIATALDTRVEARLIRPTLLAVLLGGLVAAILGTLLARSWSNTHYRALRLAENLNTHQQEQNTFLRAVIDAIPDPIFIKDRQHAWIEFNEAFCRLLGQPRATLLGKSDYDFFPKIEADVFWLKDEQVFSTREVNINEESFTDAQKRTHTISTKKVVVEIPGRGPTLVGVIRDITPLKSAEAAAKMASLGQMAGGVAHEINNPLTVIQMRAEMIEKQLAGGAAPDPAALSRLCQDLRSMCQRISRIIEGLRYFSRDNTQLPRQHCDLGRIIDETMVLCDLRFKQSGVKLEVTALTRLTDIPLLCHPVQISQVLLNLLNNAIDAVAASNEKWVHLDITKDANHVLIRVSDSGPGIPEHIRSRIMEPFFSTKEIGKGTGLGLSLSKGIAESHGGSLFLDTRAQHTTFVLRLPLV